jgi:glucosylceramidase
MKNALLLFMLFTLINCQKKQELDPIIITPPPPPPVLPVKVWTTSGNQYALLTPQTIDFATKKDETLSTITIETNQEFQKIEGFGYTLTGGSAQLLKAMSATERKALLEELFGKNTNSIGVSYLRISIGSSDLDANVFSYNDLPSGQTDVDIQQFSMAKDSVHLLPMLKEILAIAPNVKIMGSPWSAPVWMKTNQSTVGGSLKPQYYATYAQYFVKYLQVMKANGITLDAVTLQNEPENGGNNPSMVMTAAEQTDFIKNHIGPAFQAAGITTKIILFDHNCDHPIYPISVLNDPAAKAFVAGSAFHLYAGDISALTQVHQAHPDKDVYFTEQYVSKNGQFSGDLNWHIKNVMIGSMRNWSRVALEWNLANDPNFGPHTLGGCDQCLGAVTINGSAVTKNVSFYIVGQLAKFIPVGSTRLGSNLVTQLPNVAFKTPEGKLVLLVLNEGNSVNSFNINAGDKWIKASLQPYTVGTFVF